MEHKQVSIFDVISEQNKTEEYFCNHEYGGKTKWLK